MKKFYSYMTVFEDSMTIISNRYYSEIVYICNDKIYTGECVGRLTT